MYQEKIIKILEKELEMTKIIPTDYLYMNLGMDSLDAALVANAIEVEFKLPPESVIENLYENFNSMTVADLVLFVQMAKQPLKQKAPKKKKTKPTLTNAQFKELTNRLNKQR